MTFEEAYGKWLVLQLNNGTKTALGISCKQYDEVSFKPLRYNTEQIAVIINGGGAARSAVIGQDQNNVSLQIVLICKSEYASGVRSVIDSVQRAYNALPSELTYYDEAGNKIIEQLKSVFFTPIVFDESDYPTETSEGTIKAVFMSFTVNVTYGQTAVVSPSAFSLSVGENVYEILHVIGYDAGSVPAYDSFLGQGDNHPQQRAISANNSYSLTIAKVMQDPFQKLLSSEIKAKEGLYGKKIVLVVDGETINVRTYELVESYVDNAAVYRLTFAF